MASMGQLSRGRDRVTRGARARSSRRSATDAAARVIVARKCGVNGVAWDLRDLMTVGL